MKKRRILTNWTENHTILSHCHSHKRQIFFYITIWFFTFSLKPKYLGLDLRCPFGRGADRNQMCKQRELDRVLTVTENCTLTRKYSNLFLTILPHRPHPFLGYIQGGSTASLSDVGHIGIFLGNLWPKPLLATSGLVFTSRSHSQNLSQGPQMWRSSL